MNRNTTSFHTTVEEKNCFNVEVQFAIFLFRFILFRRKIAKKLTCLQNEKYLDSPKYMLH